MNGRAALSMAILLVSSGAGLLSLVALRWIGFLGLPPVLFLVLLLTGIPVGGFLLLRIGWLRARRLDQVIWLSTGLAVAGGLVFVLAVHWTHTSIDLSNPDFPSLILDLFVRFLLTAAAFLPLFVGYGLVEFGAYRAGIAGLSGNSALVYALNLLGLLFAFLGYRVLLVRLGTSGLFALGLACLFLAAAVLRRGHWLSVAGTLACSGILLVPGLEAATVAMLEVKEGKEAINNWRAPPHELLLDRWTPHCRLSVVDVGWGIAGFYEGIYYWSYPRGMPPPGENPAPYRRPDLAFSLLVRPGDRVAVLGAGGGVQVAAALRAGAGRVHAVEVVPEVLQVLSGQLAERIEGIYTDPRVTLVARNARRFLEDTDQEFDVIVVASVESHLGGMRDLFEPAQTLFTREAFATMKSRLAPGGILSLSKYTAMDRRGVIIQQSVSQLTRLGLDPAVFIQLPARDRGDDPDAPGGFDDMMARGVHYLVVAQNGRGAVDAVATLGNIYRGTRVRNLTHLPDATGLPEITDDRAFATGLLISNLGVPGIAAGIGAVGSALLLLGLILLLLFRRPIPGEPGRPAAARGIVAPIVVGFNFMTLEYLLVYRLMDRLDIPMDAPFLGMVVFVACAAAGGILLSGHKPTYLLAVITLLATALVATGIAFPALSLVTIAAAAFVTGTLFPRILRGREATLMRVYVWDAYGTLWGGLAAMLVPLFIGFSGHQVLAGAVLLLAGFAVHRGGAHRRGSEDGCTTS